MSCQPASGLVTRPCLCPPPGRTHDTADLFAALISFPNPLPSPLTDHEMFPILAGAVRDLANDNIITSVMLTGVMLLQVSAEENVQARNKEGPIGLNATF